VSIIPKITDAINNSKSRVTGMTPMQVGPENALQVWKHVYGDVFKSSQHSKFQPNDHVRIARDRMLFRKGYLPTFSDEIFKVDYGVQGKPHVYELRDGDNKRVVGKFYEPEMVKTIKNTSMTTGDDFIIKSFEHKVHRG
jgi:hypothetical protein